MPTYELLRGRNLLARLSDYEAHLGWSPDQISAEQFGRLQGLLRHAFEHTSYYRKVWSAAGVSDVSDIGSLADFQRLPIVTKDNVRDHYADFLSDAHGNNIRKSTGGSTGQPFHFELDRESNTRREAVMWRGYGGLGAGLGEKTLYLWGADLGAPSKISRLKGTLYHAFYNRKMLNSFAMTTENMSAYVDAINSFRPSAIVTYVNPLYELARHMVEKDLSVWRPRCILTGAEPLYDFQRETIQKAFHAPVYNTYGCREFMLIAAECASQRALHINADHLLVEALDDTGTPVVSQSGDLVITDLFNYGMPLIRYLNGDRATLRAERCSCESPLPVMDSVDGRSLDVIRTVSGRLIPGELFPHMFKEFKFVRRFQVVQQSIDSIQIKIVSDDALNETDTQRISTEINRYSEGELQLDFEQVDEIPLTSSGKHQVTICEIGL